MSLLDIAITGPFLRNLLLLDKGCGCQGFVKVDREPNSGPVYFYHLMSR